MKDLEKFNLTGINIDAFEKISIKPVKFVKKQTSEDETIIEHKTLLDEAIDADYEVLPKETLKSKFLSIFRR